MFLFKINVPSQQRPVCVGPTFLGGILTRTRRHVRVSYMVGAAAMRTDLRPRYCARPPAKVSCGFTSLVTLLDLCELFLIL